MGLGQDRAAEMAGKDQAIGVGVVVGHGGDRSTAGAVAHGRG